MYQITVFLISLFLSISSFASDCDQLSKKVFSSAYHNRKLYFDLASCKKIPNDSNLIIFSWVLENEEEESDYSDKDLGIVIAKSDSGEVVAKYLKKAFFNIGNGGTEFTELKVDTANYRLNTDTRAFGVVSSFGGRYGVEEQITLYVLKQNKINPVLSNLVLSSSPTVGLGELECAGIPDSETKRTIVMTQDITNGFNDILVNEKKVKYKITKKSCDEEKQKVDKTTTKKYTLKYDDKKGVYNAPADIAFPDYEDLYQESSTSSSSKIFSPSFDCKKATKPTEITICANPDLAALDVENMRVYKLAKEIDPVKVKEILSSSIKEKYACGINIKCISEKYQESIERFKCHIKDSL